MGKGLTKVPRDRTPRLRLGELAFRSPVRRSPLSSFLVASGLQRNRKWIFFYSVVLRFQKVSCQSMAGGPQPAPLPPLLRPLAWRCCTACPCWYGVNWVPKP